MVNIQMTWFPSAVTYAKVTRRQILDEYRKSSTHKRSCRKRPAELEVRPVRLRAARLHGRQIDLRTGSLVDYFPDLLIQSDNSPIEPSGLLANPPMLLPLLALHTACGIVVDIVHEGDKLDEDSVG